MLMKFQNPFVETCLLVKSQVLKNKVGRKESQIKIEDRTIKKISINRKKISIL